MMAKYDTCLLVRMIGLSWLTLLLRAGSKGAFAWQPHCFPPISAPSVSQLRLSTTTTTTNDCDTEDICRHTLEAALAKMAAISESDFAARFNKRRARSVEVKESSIPDAGLGLFATEKIKSGTIISFYPVHTLGIDLGESIRRVSMDSAGQTREQQEEESSGDQTNPYLLHILGNRPLMKLGLEDLGGDSIFLDVDIDQQESIGFQSHRINDGATVLTNSEDGALAYYQASRRAKNCVHVPFGPSPLLATVTTRKIKKGDELLTTYGCSYWLESLLTETGEAGETDMTESIVSEAKEVAIDIQKGMRGVSLTHASEAEQLQAIFDTP